MTAYATCPSVCALVPGVAKHPVATYMMQEVGLHVRANLDYMHA